MPLTPPKLPPVPPEWRHRLREAQRALERADRALDILWRSRDGGVLDKVLAGASLLNEVIEYVTPDESAHEFLMRSGFTVLDTGVAPFLVRQIRTSPETVTESIPFDQAGRRLVFWTAAERPRAVAAVYYSDTLEAGPYLAGGDEDLFKALLRRSVWCQGNDLCLEPAAATISSVGDDGRSATRVGGRHRGGRDGGRDYRLVPERPRYAYIGTPGAAWYAGGQLPLGWFGHFG